MVARYFILASISLQNGTRPVPLNNAKVRDYERARKEPKSGKLVMLVAKHKRAQQGPAMLCMDDNLQECLRTYVSIMRPLFANTDEDALFIKSNGEAFPESTIGKRIITFYKKAGIRKDISISSTKIWKMIATEVHSNEPAAAGVVQKLMAHSQKTAELSYVRSSLTTTAATAHEIVKRNILAKSPAKEEAQPPTEYTTPVKEAFQEAAQSPTASMASTISRGLTSEEKDAIDLLFSDEISTKTGVSSAPG